ncbi:CD302 antigen [Biomphalaria pfeifferi]|uniref:CD302 antigen n=1 Tax=Biomphalaria pfeifferi TaxID=112525 RepID=A0AAD8AVR1_BIOPF|nr:CD302 antigen [Biomphalaria pfeifferi]
MKFLVKFVAIALCICLASFQTIDDCPPGVPRDFHLAVFKGACYQFVTSYHRTHAEARQNCESQGGTLALVKTAEVQNYLYNALTYSYRDYHDKFWIGLNDIDKEQEFKWEDGAPLTYSNWGRPPFSDSYDCVLMDLELDGQWTEYPCETSHFLFLTFHERHPYICQYSLVHQHDASTSTTVVSIKTTQDTPQPETLETNSIETYSTVTDTAETGSITELTTAETDSDTTATTITTAVTGNTDTTVLIISNSCPAFSCDLDCGMDGFQKNETTGCSLCQCAV